MERLSDEQIDALANREWRTNESDADLTFTDVAMTPITGTDETYGGGTSLVDVTVGLAIEVRELRRQVADWRVNTYGRV